MLTETFVAATENVEKPNNKTSLGIHFHDLQPQPGLKSTFKKNSSKPKCLAVSDTHVFAAQSDKAVVNVYSRERNNQEAVVPFPEKVSCIVLAGHDSGAGTLVLGTEEGRLILWELASGRQVFTPQHHLRSVTCLAIDITSNFILSGSSDTTVHLWSLPALLSFSATSNRFGDDLPLSPLRTFSHHRGAVTAVAFGHSASKNNIALSVAKDRNCNVLHYHTGRLLHTYLLPSISLCVGLDPVDRAAYVGYEDGSVQIVDLYNQLSFAHPLYDHTKQSAPTQLAQKDCWRTRGEHNSSVLCIGVTYDGTTILSGHQDGKVLSWGVSNGKYREIADFAAPVTNMLMLPPSGFSKNPKKPLKLHNVVKPRYESAADTRGGGTEIPSDYSFSVQLATNLPLSNTTDGDSFHEALTHPSFPPEILQEYLLEAAAEEDDALGQDSEAASELKKQNAAMTQQLKSSKEKVRDLERASRRRRQDDEIKAAKKKKRRLGQMKFDEIERKKYMSEPVEDDVEMREEDDRESDLSTDTDELTDSG